MLANRTFLGMECQVLLVTTLIWRPFKTFKAKYLENYRFYKNLPRDKKDGKLNFLTKNLYFYKGNITVN